MQKKRFKEGENLLRLPDRFVFSALCEYD